MDTIIQWNCRGFQANFNELHILKQDFNPVAFCLQETLLKDTDKIDFRRYAIYNKSPSDGQRVSGGSAILIKNNIIHNQISLNTPLQAVAVRATLQFVFTLCSVYIPPLSKPSAADLQSLVDQLPKPYILMGDFNGHNPIWGSSRINDKGKLIEDLISNNDLCVLNNDSHTYLHPATGTYSCLDLCLVDPSLLEEFDWSVHDDLCGSDHFPTILKSVSASTQELVPRWNFNKADWESFKTLCSDQLTSDFIGDSTDPIQVFSDKLISIANSTIPKTSTVPRIHVPWFDDNCRKARACRKKSEKYYNRHPTSINLSSVKISRAKARRTFKNNKRCSWRNFVSKINSRTPISKVWNMLHRIKGKGSKATIKHLRDGDDVLTSKQQIADKLAATISKNSSSANYVPEFQTYKARQEKININFTSDNAEDYNEPFSLHELHASLSKSHDTATGPDEIHYQLLKHLPEKCLILLLDIFNSIWEKGSFPTSWREATIVPIPKPGKDHTDPTNYRPIALTSCVCKTMERMINDRLVYFLESNNLLTHIQCGFRKNHSTTDHLVRLESFVRNAFINKQHAVSIFFDLEKAYDTTWKYGILKDLHSFGLKGLLPQFIAKFLYDRKFQVRVGSTLSEIFDQEMGVPQGSILSVTLFSIKINSLAKVLNSNTDGSLFVDDFGVSCRGRHMATIERQLQLTLDKIHKWSLENGFKFSRTKTSCIHFCNMRKVHLDPELFLNKTPIKVVKEVKFLGLLLDSKLSFIPHIKALKTKCLKALDLLKVISSTKWGGDEQTLLHLYRSLVRSKLDYGSIIYGSARPSYIKQLDTVHHQGLRLCLGAFRTSPVESLYVEADEPSLYERRIKLALQYVTKLKSNPTNPAYKCIFHPDYVELFTNHPKTISPLGIRIQDHLTAAHINLSHIAVTQLLQIPPWQLIRPTVRFDLTVHKKSDTNQLVYQQAFLQFRDKFPDHRHFYTDGSKDGGSVAAAAVSSGTLSTSRLPDDSSIFTAEAKAILLALRHIGKAQYKSFIIFSDSLSCLQAIQGCKTDHPIIKKVLELHEAISLSQYDIIFC
ncbi:MAG TPA: reverse transcriptase-like protein, partial [Desulfocapsa sulfexigens]|nr:reverse transcriptase-like protein [Desulfocapsa sulfexigens]